MMKIIRLIMVLLLVTVMDGYSQDLTKRVKPKYLGSVDLTLGCIMPMSEVLSAASILGVSTTHGVEWNPYLYTAIGTGFRVSSRWGAVEVPLYMRFRGSLYKENRKVIPYIETDLGYWFFTKTGIRDIGGQFLLGVSAGGRVKLNSFFKSFIFSVGYENVSAKSCQPDLGYSSFSRQSRFMLKVGVDF